MDQVEAQLKKLRTKLDDVPAFQQAEDVTKVPKEYIALGGGALVLFILFFGVGAGALCNIVGFVYPAFKSFEAIETQARGDDTQWLIYWVVYAFFSIIEVFVDFLLYWIPFYYPFKAAFLIWCMAPQTRGAKFLYDSFLKDFLKQNESRIDAAMDSAAKNASVIASEAVAAGADLTAAGVSAATELSKKDATDKKDE